MVKETTVKRIRILSRQGKSSNEIVRQLRREGIGIRRKTILTYAREFKGRPAKPHAERYIPRKYREVTAFERELRKKAIEQERLKHVSVYGKKDGESRRYELSGKGRNLYGFLIDAVKFPPKKRFEKISVDKDKGFATRRKSIDFEGRWDERPTITS